MKWLFKALLVLLPALVGISANAQPDSCNLRISLLTCSPGEELYSSFGHTALRVTDQATGTDLVFNYGTFDDSDPYFYLKFTRGLMMYALSVYPYRDFQWEYKAQNRSVIEQELQLSCEDKKKLQQQLMVNAQEENRFYLYYFLDDNCTTRAKDMVKKSLSSPMVFPDVLEGRQLTYRNLIHEYLDRAQQPWSKLGIDILLGARLDKVVKNEEPMFLPDYLMKGFDSATVASKPLVGSKQTVVFAEEVKPEKPWLTPGTFFYALAIIVGLLTALGTKWAQKLMIIFDRVFFFSLGLLGILLVTLWIIRVDTVCRDNFNLLWAIPSHVYIAFVLNNHKPWLRKYFLVTFIITTLLMISAVALPQKMNFDLMGLWLTIAIRSIFRSKKP